MILQGESSEADIQCHPPGIFFSLYDPDLI